ncbi:hypothetical protein Efla_005365 [Eimeria flavescens]
MPHPGLLPPGGDRLSTTAASSSAYTPSRSSSSSYSSSSSSRGSSKDKLDSTLQGSFRASKSQGLPLRGPKGDVALSSTTSVLVAAMSSANKESLLSGSEGGKQQLLQSSGKASTIQGSLRATKSEGLLLGASQQSAGSSTTSRGTPLRVEELFGEEASNPLCSSKGKVPGASAGNCSSSLECLHSLCIDSLKATRSELFLHSEGCRLRVS